MEKDIHSKRGKKREISSKRGKEREIHSKRGKEIEIVYYDITRKCMSYRDTAYPKIKTLKINLEFKILIMPLNNDNR
jgi:hypothetical protein